jgi:hypothetical protein
LARRIALENVLSRLTMLETSAAMGAAFAFTEATVANQRQKDDAINGLTGGCAAGFLAGIRG